MFTERRFGEGMAATDKRGRRRTPTAEFAGGSLRRYYRLEDSGRGRPTTTAQRDDGAVVGTEQAEEGGAERGGDADEGGGRGWRRATLRSEARQRETQPRRLRKSLAQDGGGTELAHASSNEEDGVSNGDKDARDGDKGEGAADSELASTSSDASSESEVEARDVDSDDGVEEAEEGGEKVATTDEETRRLAIVNLDWDHVRVRKLPIEAKAEDLVLRIALSVQVGQKDAVAVDILVILQSFLPRGGSIACVTVYPSDFGLQQMAEEQMQGPQVLFGGGGRRKEEDGAAQNVDDGEVSEGREEEEEEVGKVEEEEADDDDHDDSEEEGGEGETGSDGEEVEPQGGERRATGDGRPGAADEADEDSQGEGGIDMEQLRAYEKSKLRYYYAVVECDSPATGGALYRACDGMEFERSANTLDLRFIPDAMCFKARQLRDQATDVPQDYVAPNFQTRALQHSSVKLTWDEDEPSRARALRRKFDAAQLNDMDFKDYLASTSGSEDRSEDEASCGQQLELKENRSSAVGRPDANGDKGKQTELRNKYRALLLGRNSTGGQRMEHNGDAEAVKNEDDSIEEENEEEGDELEITFNAGLGELAEKMKVRRQEKRDEDVESVWDAYQRKRREKRRAKKREAAAAAGGGGAGGGEVHDGDDADMYAPADEGDDPFFARGDGDDDAFDDPFFADAAEEGGGASASRQRGILDRRRGDVKVGSTGGAKEASQAAAAAEAAAEERARRREERERERAAAAREQAELELLVMDAEVPAIQEGGSAKGYNLKSRGRKEKAAVQKAKKKGKASNGRGNEEAGDGHGHGGGAAEVTVDHRDARFGQLYSSPLFAIDPTDPQFRKSSGQLGILAEKQRRRAADARTQSGAEPNGQPQAGGLESMPALESKQKRKVELTSLVRSLKRKVGDLCDTRDSRNGQKTRSR
eukprot:SM000190S04864  [mRNA]  locus=s190:143269:147472:+ [translate_table: standard]